MNGKRPKVLVHPGFPKTGTTYLQKFVFNESPDFRTVWSIHEVDRRIVRSHDLCFDGKAVNADFQKSRESSPSTKIDVISSENLVGNPLTGARDSVSLANRLQTVVGSANILFTVRSQPTIARSLYIQHLKRGGLMKPRQFFQQTVTPGYYGFDPQYLLYDRLVRHYVNLFGEDSVLVLPQELIASDPDQFMERLLAFSLGQDISTRRWVPPRAQAGVSPPVTGIPLLRLSNRFREDALNPGTESSLSWIGRAMLRLSYHQKLPIGSRTFARVDRLIEELFAGPEFGASNAVIQRYCPVNLRCFGYDVQEQTGDSDPV
jgi:hypothetical protein